MGLEDDGWLRWVVREHTLGDLNCFSKGLEFQPAGSGKPLEEVEEFKQERSLICVLEKSLITGGYTQLMNH